MVLKSLHYNESFIYTCMPAPLRNRVVIGCVPCRVGEGV